MADLSTEYQGTNAALQANIDEALLQLGNIRNQINALGIGTFTLPDDPSEVPAAQFNFPQRPSAPVVTAPDIPRVDVDGVNASVPSAPSIDRPTSWQGPSAPQYRVGFEQFFAGDEDTPEDIITRANTQVHDWVDQYFPAIKDCFKDVPEQWVCDVISGVRPLGNSETAIEVAWRTAKANQHREMQSAKRTMSAEFSRRGFTLPPGAMVAAMQRMTERAFDANSAANREAALADVQVQAKLLELAVQTAASLKQGLLGLMSDYYRVIASLSNDSAKYGIEKARIKAQADAQFNDALLRFADINQGYYRSLRDNVLRYNGQTIDLFSGELDGARVLAGVSDTNARLQLDAAKTNAANAQVEAQIKLDVGRIGADIYRTGVQGEAARVGAINDNTRVALDRYTQIVNARLAEAQAKAPPGVGTALSGAAGAFGQIAAAAANASGTLIARVEGV